MRSTAPSSFDEHADELPREDWQSYRDSMVRNYDFTRLYADDIDRIVQGEGGYRGRGFDVVTGDLDAEDIEADLQRNEFRNVTEHEGYELYEHAEADQVGTAMGVEDGTLLVAGGPNGGDAVRTVEDVIDAQIGEARRYAAVDSEFERLMEAATVRDYFIGVTEEPPDETNAERGRFRNQIGIAFSIGLDDGDSDLSMTVLFQDERDPRERDLEDWTRESDNFRLWRDIEISIEEEVARIDATIPTRDVLEGGLIV
ncbi:hypothetical protein [Halorubrum sp. DTA98]|uniref:hypothetical protein n=1 Tax=Halorubrum sp. DTA98 TaxID=3402163 RepID=UPI003AADD1B1